MLRTLVLDRIFVSAANAKGVIRLRLGPSERGPERRTEMLPSEARKVAIFLLQIAEKMDAGEKSR
jgi:hypothetical protein